MRRPFPALELLDLGFKDETQPVLPDSFLGRSAPDLERLTLRYIPFPGLPKLLLSATHLVDLHLYNIPHSGYISPEVMVTCLSMLTRLKYFFITFESPQSRPDPPTSTSADTHPAPHSQFVALSRGQRISGGPRGLDRCPSTQRLLHIFFPSTDV